MIDRPNRRLLALGISAIISASLGFPARANGIHATYYEMDVRCVPDESRIEATARIGLREAGDAADAADFWLHGELRVTGVRADGADLQFSQKRELYRWDYSLVGNHVEITLPEGRVPDNIEVEWSGFLNPSKARSVSDYMRIDKAGVFLRALGYSPWFPILLDLGEDAHSVDFRMVSIEVPRELTAVFAGDLLSSRTEGDSARYLWRADGLSLVDAQLTARPFVVTIEDDIRVYTLTDQESLASSEKIVSLTRTLVRYFSDHYAADAVSGQVHVVEMPEYGDISSGNVVGIQETSWRAFEESGWAKRTLAHELVHPFVQPMISRSDPLHALMIEGFPSFFHLPALAATGAIDYDVHIAGTRESYLRKQATGKDRRGRPLPTEKPISQITADEIGTYKDRFVLSDRTLLLLDDLRSRMGESRFRNLTRELFAQKAMDDQAFRGLVLRYLPGFEERLAVWLDTSELPAASSE